MTDSEVTNSEVTADPTVDPDLIDMMDSVFASYRDTRAPDAPVSRDPELWSRLEELGLLRLTGSEATGGSGAGWYEAAELMSAAVRHGVRIPLAEHDLLACGLLETVGAAIDPAARTVCVLDESGTAVSVPWASTADRVVLVWPDGTGFRVSDVPADRLRITAATNMIGEPRDTVVAVDLGTLRGEPVSEDVTSALGLKSALIRAIQVCAALDAMVELTVEHTSARIQFGRPLSKFQAIQHAIADIASEAALARAATEAALTAAVASSWSAPDLPFRIAVARSCAGHAASVAVRNAHQCFGAIGTTREHRLHEYSRAALAWRAEYGSVRHWDEVVTRAAVGAGASGLWPLIAT